MIRNIVRSLRILGPVSIIPLVALILLAGSLVSVWRFGVLAQDLVSASDARDVYLIQTNQETMQSALDALQTSSGGGLSADTAAALVDQARQSVEAHVQRVTATKTSNGYTMEELGSGLQGEIQAGTDPLTQVNSAVMQAVTDIQDYRFSGMIIGIVILSAFPLLALWAFVAVSGFTAPLLAVSSAFAAIGGRRYRPEMLADVRRRRGLRNLARACDELSETLTQRRQNLQHETEALREQLYETRRSKLDIIETNLP